MSLRSLQTLRRTGPTPARLVRLLLVSVVAVQIGATALSAQTPRVIRFEHMTTEQGLPQDGIHAIYQDSVGFMWFGTQEGLVRYDGYTFMVYTHDPEDPSSLASGWVWSLVEDRKGDLWVGTDRGGLHRFDRAAETFEQFRYDEADPTSLSSDRVRVVFEDQAGVLWVGTDEGLNRLDADGVGFQRFTHDPSDPSSISSNQIRTIIEEAGGALWVGTDGGGINRLDQKSGSFTSDRHHPNDPYSLGSDRVYKLHQSADGTMWVGFYESGLDRLDPDQNRFVHYRYADGDVRSLPGDRVHDVLEDSDGTVWVATDGGLTEWDPGKQDFTRHQRLPTEPASLSDNRVNVVYEDRGGVLWVGTFGGLNRFSLAAGSFVHYKHSADAQGGLSHNVVTAFDEDEHGNIWVGTYGGGLNRLDANGRFTHYRHDGNDPGSLVDDRVMALRVDRTGVIWIGTYADGLDRFDPTTETFTHFRYQPENPTSLSGDAVTSILKDRTGKLWVGTYRTGLNRLDPETGGFTRFRHDPLNALSLSSDLVLALHEDQSGVLWIGTDGGGLNRLRRGVGAFEHYRHDPEDEFSLSNDSAWSVYEDRTGGFWIGTQGGGLNYWSPADRQNGLGRFRRYLKADGLPSAVVYGASEDWHGRLWISTNHGLSRLNPATGNVKNYTTKHGLQDLDFNFGAVFRSRENRLYFGGSNGFNSFYPDAIVESRQKPPVVLTGVYKLNERVALDVPAHALTAIALETGDTVVAFEFAVLDYTAPDSNRYQYRLDDFDVQWNEAGTLGRATYTNLDPGEYTFRVRGANSDGVWDDGVALQLVVPPPWWMTAWAFGLYVLIAIALVWEVRRRHLKSLGVEASRSRQLEGEVAIRTNELGERNAQLTEANRQLKVASHTDTLTGLYNRRFLGEQVEKDVALVLRGYTRDNPNAGNTRRDLLFLMLDVDGLKGVNDKYGHLAGDRALVQIREILGRVCRNSDMLVRWGGDEFLLVARESDRATGEHLAERLRKAIMEHEFQLGGGNTTSMSCSIGFAMYPFMPSAPKLLQWEQVIHMADRGLYQAKESGKNRYVGIFPARNADPPTVLKRLDDDLDVLVDENVLTLRRGPTTTADATEADRQWPVPVIAGDPA